ncbi:enoyl-CoA hydratase/isomerase family protein [Alloalcanivorax mobilis]|uniref:enoyl-CoA hydratase/isomerase family protein n=1 Tax=Alloalcanivorax mobilis TaxID=2019569 RepID=UPI000B5B1803|nr:enoyl-CoA hydratase/isomerase family protein [Alloalcanivorax mobilis]ASK35661.1 enoyl-CoA hydratase [Alcanivorax sp. N3-2A]
MTDQAVLMETRGAVAVVTINAFEMRNSMGAPGVRDGLLAAIERFENDAALRVFVLTGSGGVFSAGGNLDALRKIRDLDKIRERLKGGGPLLERILTSDKLYVSAVEGPAFGAGLGLAAACDLMVAAEGARFCAAQIRVGAAPDGSLMWSLPFRVGTGPARRILLTGEEVNLDDAVRIGLVDVRADKGEALAVAMRHAERLAAGPPLAQAYIKRQFADLAAGLSERLDEERETAARTFVSDDFLEGASAFLEKRKARFKGE